MFWNTGLGIRFVYALCLLGATYNHVLIIATHGLFWNYGGVSWPSAAYWTMLTFADPVTAAFLFLRPRLGLISTAAIISSDVLHNAWITVSQGERFGFPHHIAPYTMLIEQTAFLIFVAATIRVAWVQLPRRTSNG